MNGYITGLLAGLIAAVSSAAHAVPPSENTGRTCSEARDFCVVSRNRAKVSTGVCAPTFKRCLQTGTWKTKICNLTGLKKM